MGRVLGMQISSPPKISLREARLFFPEANVKVKSHGPFRNCIPVRLNQVIKGIEISQWPLHI